MIRSVTPRDSHKLARETALSCPNCGALACLVADARNEPAHSRLRVDARALLRVIARLRLGGLLRWVSIEEAAEAIEKGDASPTVHPRTGRRNARSY